MASKSKIEWTDATWNPIGGCTRVSEGCRFCYAEVLAASFATSRKQDRYEGLAGYIKGKQQSADNARWTGDIKLFYDMLDRPLRWRKPRMIFVNSMSDMFHEKVPVDYIHQIFGVMNQANQHIYQVLTKRDERLVELNEHLDWSPHIWQGVSVENQETTGRIDNLLKTDAKVKFLSIEPLIGRVLDMNLDGIDWVIVGGESGKSARHMAPVWVEDIIDQCRNADVPVFVKQMGTVWGRAHNSDWKGQKVEDWPENLRVREYPDHVLGGTV